jgi:hypothetical protein
MKAVIRDRVVFGAIVLVMATLGGCAPVHQNPASNVVNGQSDSASATQVADAPPLRQSSVPF